MSTIVPNPKTLKDYKKQEVEFIYNLYLSAGISYWGDMIAHYETSLPEQPTSFTIIENGDSDNVIATYNIETHELFQACFNYSIELLKKNRTTGGVNRYLLKAAKEIAAMDCIEASYRLDHAVSDVFIQQAIFGHQKYA